MNYETFADILNVHLLPSLPALKTYVAGLSLETKQAWHQLCRDLPTDDVVHACRDLAITGLPNYEFGQLGQRILARCHVYAAERSRKEESARQIELARQGPANFTGRMLNVRALDAHLDQVFPLPPISAPRGSQELQDQITARASVRRERMRMAGQIADQFLYED